MSEQAKRYRGFISYSQKDKAYARRLHQALERYRFPKGVEAPGIDAKSRKLGRFFRDDEEMGAATDLGAALQGAIADAESLIVICSPHAAQSRWVNEEIIHFKRTGRADCIFAVIVAGEPTPAPERRDRECFPPALRFELEPDGALSDRAAEPLGLDMRREPFVRLVTRMAAGLVRTPFDALWKREQRRARARTATLSIAVLALAVIIGGAVTQNLWRPRLDAYFRYERLAHDTAELLAAQPGTTFQDCREESSDCPVMVVIPGGTFIMGDAPRQTGLDDLDRPQFTPDERQRISVAGFAVSQHEVTFANWEACAAAGGCRVTAEPSDSRFGRENRPVINVSWDDASEYVRWLSSMTGYRYRLLTEAEWEYAARGVTSADDPRNGEAWGFGNDESQLADYAWYNENSDIETHPVGTRRANSFGLFDMHGNVSEWVDDCAPPFDPNTPGFHGEFDPYLAERAAHETPCSRIIRGGSWYDPPTTLRSADRSEARADTRINGIGFRVARTF